MASKFSRGYGTRRNLPAASLPRHYPPPLCRLGLTRFLAQKSPFGFKDLSVIRASPDQCDRSGTPLAPTPQYDLPHDLMRDRSNSPRLATIHT